MNIIFNKDAAYELRDKYTVLELDTVMQPGLNNPVVLHAVIEPTLLDIVSMNFYKESHANFIAAYKSGDWSNAIDMAKALLGQWNGELDQFYHLAIDFCKENARLGNSWDGIRHTIPKEEDN